MQNRHHLRRRLISLLPSLLLGGGALVARGQCALIAPPAPTASAAATRPATAGPAWAPAQPMAVAATVGRFDLAAVAPDHLEFSIQISMVADRNASVNEITFTGLRLNGLPLFAVPASQQVRLAAGQSAALPQPLRINLYYRDLDSLEPVSQLLRTGRARIEGTLTLGVQLNWAEKLYLRALHAEVVTHFRNDVPVQFPSGSDLRSVAESAVSTASGLLTQANSGADAALALLSRQRRAIKAQFAPALLLSRTTFALDDGRGHHLDYACLGTGFRIDASQFILPKADIQPWNFDAEIAAAMQHQHLKVPDASYDLTVWPAEARWHDAAGGWADSAGWSESRHQIQLLRLAKDDSETVLVPHGTGRPVKIKLQRLESSGNLALLQFLQAASAAAPPPPRLDPGEAQVLWDGLATFRFDPVLTTTIAHPELIFLAAGRDGATIHLNVPVDSGAWGAPLIGPNGVVGIVQSESAGLSLAAALQALNWAAPAGSGPPAHR